MVEKKKNKLMNIKNEVKAAKDILMDFTPRLFSLLNPVVWQSQETATMALATVLGGLATSRVKKMFESISEKKDDLDEEVVDSEKTNQVLLDLVRFAAHDNPDMETWEAAKKIFIKTMEKGVKDQERASLYELLAICRDLKGTEIKIIAGAYKIYKLGTGLGPNGNQRRVHNWAIDISNEIGLQTAEEVLRYEDNLIKQHLIVQREILRGDFHDAWVGVTSSSGHRLTPLGLKLAESLVK